MAKTAKGENESKYAATVVVILIGAAGSGKTTIGRALANRHHCRFVDGDDYHATDAVAKMRRGSALTDAERAPWLASLHAVVAAAIERREPLVVVACSALKQRYRDVVRGQLRTVRFVYLRAAEAVLHQRLGQREGHFAGPELLASQLATLEEPADALTLTVDASRPPDDIVARINREFGL